MRKHLIRYFAVAALSIGPVGWLANTFADEPVDATKSTAEKSGDAAKAPVDNGKDATNKTDAAQIESTLATSVEASAATKGGLNDLVERFAEPDRNRIGKIAWTEEEQKKLDGRIAQFQKDWKEKYGQDFKIKDEAAVFKDSFARIETGEVGSNARLASDQQKNSQGTESKENVIGQKKNELESGRNIATVTIAASHDLPELTVPLIQEAPLGKWKINIPDNVDGQKLKDNILKHLTMIDEMKDKWPADVNEAYRAVAHHILAAVLDADNAKPGATDTGATPAPAPANP